MFDVGKEKAIIELNEQGHGRQEERYVSQRKGKLSPELMVK